MNPNYFQLVIHRIGNIKTYFRFVFYKLRGLQIKNGSQLGKITCDWPNKLIIGNNCIIQDNVDFRIYQPYNKESYIQIGETVFIGHACEFVCSKKISIGNNCLIASKTTFNDTGHEFSKKQNINSQPVTVGEITIEDDVWIGTSCVILQGITIGKGSVIGAGSIVNKSIPPFQVWAGIPARFIRNRD